eukprot:scaffold52603_cov48-Phaeocystis_antarctica.AAC.2
MGCTHQGVTLTHTLTLTLTPHPNYPTLTLTHQGVGSGGGQGLARGPGAARHERQGLGRQSRRPGAQSWQGPRRALVGGWREGWRRLESRATAPHERSGGRGGGYSFASFVFTLHRALYYIFVRGFAGCLLPHFVSCRRRLVKATRPRKSIWYHD